MVAFERRWSRGEKEQVSLRGLSRSWRRRTTEKKERGKKAKIVTSGRRPTRRHSCKSWPCDTWLYANYNITRDPRTAAHAPTWPVSVSSFRPDTVREDVSQFSAPTGYQCVSRLLCVWEWGGCTVYRAQERMLHVHCVCEGEAGHSYGVSETTTTKQLSKHQASSPYASSSSGYFWSLQTALTWTSEKRVQCCESLQIH